MNDRQKAFCEHYAACGNGAESARRAGYSSKTARTQASELLTNPDILEYIQELREHAATARIASLAQLRAFWSDTLYDSGAKMGDRLKASELLAKSLGAFMTVRPDDGGAGDRVISAGAYDGEDVLIFLPDNGRDAGIQHFATEADIERLNGGKKNVS